ncbi:hypothetical protein RJT34_08933 [Clitoria ternatea]|uniref:Protein kinase domain-containing protein n=1 Tax=Clitoria ternatea TaxID=43366 RepID=A0AAN9K589_CLITE
MGKNSGIPNRNVHGFGSQVDDALRSTTITLTDSGTSRVYDYTFLVNSALRTVVVVEGTSQVHSFASQVNSALRSVVAGHEDLETSLVHSFASQVNNALRSVVADHEDLETSPVHSFASQVNSALRSVVAGHEDLGTSHVHSFASQVNNAPRSVHEDSRRFRVRSFASRVDNDVKSSSIAAPSVFAGFQRFTLGELILATNNFSIENKIGAGSYGVVYSGKLPNGSQVAVKRGKTNWNMKKYFQAFKSLWTSRCLQRGHLVIPLGFCQEKHKRLLVYEYMKNGSLYDHLHHNNNVEKSSNVLDSWRRRIRIALDASRGIQNLHNHAVPALIHGDIKSSNILLDALWRASVSDLGLSSLSLELDRNHQQMKAVGTVGYIDPEYYDLSVFPTTKSDVYSFGVVLLELLTGKKAISWHYENGIYPLHMVDLVVPSIMNGKLVEILDPRVGPPEVNEVEAVELVACTAIHCVRLEGKDRPTMTNVVLNLELALAICDSEHSYDI